VSGVAEATSPWCSDTRGVVTPCGLSGFVGGYSRAQRIVGGAGPQPPDAGGDAIPDLVVIPLIFCDE
jgi:hypothetical protein